MRRPFVMVSDRHGKVRQAHKVDVQVGRKLQIRRLQLKMTQSELGEHMDRIACVQVFKYERGLNRISASKLWEAAHALQVPIEYFFKGLKAPHVDPAADARLDSILEAGAVCPQVEMIPRLDKRAREAVGGLIEALSPKNK